MADSESDVSMTSPSAVTMITSLNPPPSDVMEAVNQSNAVIPALFALPSEGGNAKKLKLCKRVGWLRDGVFTTGFMEINIKEAKQKGIFNQPRHVTLVQGEDSIFQSQVIQGQKAPSSKQLSSLVLSPGTSTMGIISARGKVIPKRITVVKNVPFAIKSKGKLIALGKVPSFGTLANKAGTSADTATGHQNQTEGSEVAKNFSMVTHGLSTPNVQDSAPGWQMLPHPSSHYKESVLVEDEKVCVKTKQDCAAPAGETQSFPAKKRLRKQKRSPRITRAKMKDRIPPKVTKLGSPRTDICHLKSWSNPKLDLLKMDIDFSRHNVLQMEGLIHLPCDPSPSEFNCLDKEIPETRRNSSDKVQEAPELYSILSKGATNKHLENQTTAQSKNRTVENGQYSTECSKQTLVHEEQEQNTDAVGQSEPIQIKKVVRSSDKQEKFQKRKFDEACSPTTNRASSKLKCHLSEELSCGEPAVKYTKVVNPELSGTPPTNLGSKTGLSQHYDPDPFLQNERNRCGQVFLSGNQDIFIQNKRPECVARYCGDNITTNANTCSLQDVGAKASSQNNKGVTTNCPMPPVQTVGGQTSSHAVPVNFSTSVNSDLELTEGNHFGINSRNTLSITTISETNNERPSLPSDSSVDKTTLNLASDGVPLLQIGSVYSLSAEEAKRLFPKASIETPSEVVETNQSPVDADSNIPKSSSTSGSVVEPSATKVNLELLDLSIDSQPSQSQTSDISICPIQAQTIETVSTTTCTLQTTRLSSSAISNSPVKTTSVQHTTPLPPVVCINGQVLTLDPNKLPGKVQKDPMELVVIAPPNTAHNVGQNVIPKTLHVSHSRMSSIQIEKPPSQQQSKVHATSIIVPLTQTVTVLGPPVFRNPGNKSSSVLNISSVSVQSSFRRTPLFQNGSFVGCNTTFVPTSVMPNAASDVSCSTSAGSVCTSISSSSAVGSICSTDTESVKKPTQQNNSTTSNQNTPEAEGQRTFLITTNLGENKLISFPSTANGVHILSQMTQAHQDNQVFLNQLQAKKHKEILKNDAVGKQANKILKPTPILAHGSSDNNTDKAISLNTEIEKNPQSDIGEKHKRKRRGRNKHRTTAKGHKGSQEANTTTCNVTTQSLAKYLHALTHNEDLGNKYNTSKVTRPSSQSDGTPGSRPNLPRPNDNRNKRKRFIPSNFCEKSAGLSFDRNEGSLPETQSNIHKKGMKPAGPLSTSQKGTRPSSQPNVSKRGRPPSATSLKTNRRGTTPLSQPNVRKRGRPPATPLNTNQKSTSRSSQPNVRKRGRPLVTPLNTSKKSITPSSQPNVRKKGRTPAIHLNPNQKGTAPSSQLNVRKRGRTPATPLNKNQKDTTPSSQPNVSKKRRTPVSPLNPNQKGTTPPSQSNARKKGRPPAIHLNPNLKGTTPSSQSKLSKKGKPPAIQLNTSRKGTTPSSQLNVNKKCRTQAALSNTSSKGALPSPKSAVSRGRSTPAIPSNVIGKSCSRSSLADVLQKSHVQATLSNSNKKRNSTSPATQSSLKKTDNSTLSLPHVNQTSSMSATSWSVSKNDTTISSLSDVYRESSSQSYIYREDRLMQLKKLMKQKEQDIEDMKKLRQLEVREKLSDPELCDL